MPVFFFFFVVVAGVGCLLFVVCVFAIVYHFFL